MIIDCHAHLVPPSLLDAIRSQAANFPSVRLIEDGGSLGFSFAGGKPTRPVSKPLTDLAGRLQWMDTQKVDRQVVAGWLDSPGHCANIMDARFSETGIGIATGRQRGHIYWVQSFGWPLTTKD